MRTLTVTQWLRAFPLLALLIGFSIAVPEAKADAYVDTWVTQNCFTYGTPGPGNLPGGFDRNCGQAFSFYSHKDSLSYDKTFDGEKGSTDPHGLYTSAHSSLTFDVSPAEYHATAEGNVSVQNNTGYSLADDVVSGSAKVDVTGFDFIHFASSSLAPGSTVDFALTEYLDSQISGPCSSNGASSVTGNNATGAYAFYQVSGMQALSHDSCGGGSNHMSATAVLHSTVGGSVQLVTRFIVTAGSGLDYHDVPFNSLYTVNHTANAAHTGGSLIEILTPGVTFTSDSGATYQPSPVPEPNSLALLCAGILGGAARYLYRRRPRSGKTSKI